MIGPQVLKNIRLTNIAIPIFLVAVALSGCGKPADVAKLIDDASAFAQKGDIDKAIQHYKIATGFEPKRPELRVALAELYLQSGDNTSAEKEILAAVRLGHTDLSGAVILGQALLARNKPSEVLKGEHLSAFGISGLDEHIPQAIRVELLNLEGYAYWQLQDLEASEESYNLAYSLDPKHADVLVGKALVSLLRQDRLSARNWLGEALKVRPDSPFALRNLAEIEKREGNFAAAENAYTKAINGGYNNSDDHFSRALLRMQQGNYRAAAADLTVFKKKSRRKHLEVYGRGLLAFHEKKYEIAVQSFTEVLSEVPDYLPAITYAGLGNFLLQNYEQAVNQLQEVRIKQPGSIEIRRALALIHVKLGDLTSARSVAEEILSLVPDDKEALQIIGSTAITQGDTEQGIKILQRLSEAENENPNARINYGVGLLSDGQFDEGFKQLQSASEFSPGKGVGYGAMAFSYLAKGELKKATEVANQAIQRLPKNPLGWNLLGGIAISENDLEKAKSAFLEALKIAPGEPSASHNLASIALTDGNVEEARGYYRDVLKVNPAHSRSFFKLAKLELLENNRSAAIANLKLAISHDPKHADSRFILAKIQMNDGEKEAALETLEDLRTSHPENPKVPALLATHYLSLDNSSAAIDVIKDALRNHPKSALLYNVLGTAFAQSGDGKNAELAFSQVFRVGVKYPVIQVDTIRSLIHMGSLDIAEKALAEMEKIHGEYLEAFMLWGMLEMKRGELAKSQSYFVSALKNRPNHRESTLLLARAHSRATEYAESAEILDSWLASNPTDSQAKFQRGNVMSHLGNIEEAVKSYEEVISSEPKHVLALT